MPPKQEIIQSKDIEYIDVPFEIKSIHDDDDEFFRFEGLASAFGNIDKTDDIIREGTFIESIEKITPTILWMHQRDRPIGMPQELKEIEQGLFVLGRLPKADRFVSEFIIPQIKVGSIRKMSIGFRVLEREIQDDIRIITKAELPEISLVTSNFEANSLAAVTGFKTAQEAYNVGQVKEFTKRELEKSLRDSGAFSKDAAMYIANFAKQGEPVGEESDIKADVIELSSKVDGFLISNKISNLIRR
jgi:hypothetical protein